MANELNLITPVNDVFRRDIALADPTLGNPTNAVALIQGEWLMFDASGKGVRATLGSRGAFQMFTQKGDLGGQAIGKVTVLQIHEYEADTIIFDDAFAGAVGDPLTVGTITYDTVVGTYSGLKVAGVGDIIYGVVTKLPAQNGGKLRFMRVMSGGAL